MLRYTHTIEYCVAVERNKEYIDILCYIGIFNIYKWKSKPFSELPIRTDNITKTILADEEQIEFLYTAGWSVNWNIHF